MNNRKQQVINKAHQLFIDNGYQATSIQDILDHSGISKGTFYNYFSSKNELLMAIFKTSHKKLEEERNKLLIGQDRSNIEIFIKQIELQMITNKKNKLLALFEEVMVSNDAELKQFIKLGYLKSLQWVYERLIDIFDESKKPYLLDCSIMFLGILQHNIKYYFMAHDSNASVQRVVRYSVDRLVKMVKETAETGDQLIEPELLEKWLPNCRNATLSFQQDLCYMILTLKKGLLHDEEQSKYIELLDFIQDELLHTRNPRRFLLESTLLSLNAGQSSHWRKELQKLVQLVEAYFNQLEEAD